MQVDIIRQRVFKMIKTYTPVYEEHIDNLGGNHSYITVSMQEDMYNGKWVERVVAERFAETSNKLYQSLSWLVDIEEEKIRAIKRAKEVIAEIESSE